MTWWAHPLLYRVRMDQYGYFDQRAVVPVAYAAFAIALASPAAAPLRRTPPAIAATLAGFVAVRLGFTIHVSFSHPSCRPHTSTRRSRRLTACGSRDHTTARDHVRGKQPDPPERDGAVVTHRRRVGSSGDGPAPAHVPRQSLSHDRASAPAVGHRRFARRAWKPGYVQPLHPAPQRHLHLATTYQPPSRYWPLQWSESASSWPPRWMRSRAPLRSGASDAHTAKRPTTHAGQKPHTMAGSPPPDWPMLFR